jgi:hypothetical protein
MKKSYLTQLVFADWEVKEEVARFINAVSITITINKLMGSAVQVQRSLTVAEVAMCTFDLIAKVREDLYAELWERVGR